MKPCTLDSRGKFISKLLRKVIKMTSQKATHHDQESMTMESFGNLVPVQGLEFPLIQTVTQHVVPSLENHMIRPQIFKIFRVLM